jgi:hypothetical protein
VTDLERELTEGLQRRAAELRLLPGAPPPGVRARIRRRQLAWAAVSLVAVAALVVGSTAAIRALSTFGPQPSTRLPATTRTLSAGGARLTYPSGWQAVSLFGDGPRYVGRPDVTAVLPVLQVANFDAAAASEICPDGSGAFPATGVLLYLEEDLAFPGDRPAASAWPVRFEPTRTPSVPANACGPSGQRIRFTASGRTFEVHLLAGPGASRQDLAATARALGTMGFGARPWYAVEGPFTIPLGPREVVASGTFHGRPWSIQAQPTDRGTCLFAAFPGTPVWVDPGLCVTRAHPGFSFGTTGEMVFREPGGARVALVYGTVGPPIARVEFRGDHGRVVDATLAPLPDLGRISVFALAADAPSEIQAPGAVQASGHLIGWNEAGREVGRFPFGLWSS